VEETGRRRSRRAALQSEDRELSKRQRSKLVSNTRDLQRNMSIAAWAIRKHLDYCSTFSFQCRTGILNLDDRIESLMTWWSRPVNCDISSRHSLQRLVRLAEERRTIDGDVFIMKLSDGRIQIIEGDRVQTPSSDLPASFDSARLVHGVDVSSEGRARRYVICDRGDSANRFTFRAAIPAEFIYQHGFFDRYDQVRGVSPLAAALNTFSDVYECAEYALAKAKVSQLFGLKFKRAGDQPLTPDDNAQTPYQFNFGQGPQLLDLDPGDDAEFIESNTPSTEFSAYCEKMIGASLKALDIPYSFYDESFTNYSGARQALLQYEQSAQCKRADVQQFLNQLTAWRVGLWIEDGELALPKGMMLGDVTWDWIPAGLPWIDPLKEVNADVTAIQAGLSSRQQVCRERGQDFFSIADQLAQEHAYMKEKGLISDPVEVPASGDERADEQTNDKANDQDN